MSQRHPGSRKVHHQSAAEPDDLFIARVLGLTNWARGNQQALTVGVVVLVIAVLGGLYYRSFQGQLTGQAAQQLEVIHQSIAINDTEGAKIDLATFLDRFGGTAYEGEARLVLGELYLDSGDPQQAMAVLEPLGASPRAPIDFQGAALLAVAYEQEEQWDEAESVYMTIASRSELDFQIQDALSAAARIRGARGDTAGAIELYERVLDGMEENAPNRGLYEMRIAEMQNANG